MNCLGYLTRHTLHLHCPILQGDIVSHGWRWWVTGMLEIQHLWDSIFHQGYKDPSSRHLHIIVNMEIGNVTWSWCKVQILTSESYTLWSQLDSPLANHSQPPLAYHHKAKGIMQLHLAILATTKTQVDCDWLVATRQSFSLQDGDLKLKKWCLWCLFIERLAPTLIVSH